MEFFVIFGVTHSIIALVLTLPTKTKERRFRKKPGVIIDVYTKKKKHSITTYNTVLESKSTLSVFCRDIDDTVWGREFDQSSPPRVTPSS